MSSSQLSVHLDLPLEGKKKGTGEELGQTQSAKQREKGMKLCSTLDKRNKCLLSALYARIRLRVPISQRPQLRERSVMRN